MAQPSNFLPDKISEQKLWKKLTQYAEKAGMQLVYGVLLLFYGLQDRDVPISAKAVISGAILYFILPLDLIPDFVPLTGLTDDFSVISMALYQVAIHLTDGTKHRAFSQLQHWFPQAKDEDFSQLNRWIGRSPDKDSATPEGQATLKE